MPIVTKFGDADAPDGQEMQWIDIDLADAAEHAWLTDCPDLDEQTRTLLLEPVRFSRREHLVDGLFLGLIWMPMTAKRWSDRPIT